LSQFFFKKTINILMMIDIAANYIAAFSRDYVDGDNDPSNGLFVCLFVVFVFGNELLLLLLLLL
jgi:hypothetical protein